MMTNTTATQGSQVDTAKRHRITIATVVLTFSIVFSTTSRQHQHCHTFVHGLVPIYHQIQHQKNSISRRNVLVHKFLVGSGIVATVLPVIAPTLPAMARLEPVNKPNLLPSEKGLNVLQMKDVSFLTPGQIKRMNQLLTALERDTGYRVRVLCQAYPNTPGLAIREYWDVGNSETQKDDRYVVLIVDEFSGKGNVLNFNVGDGMKLVLPNIFWTRLQSKYGNTFFVRDNGIDIAITTAIDAIVSCLRSEDQYCINVPDELQSFKSLGMFS